MELAVRAASREQNPLWNENKMKLGIFGANVSNGCAMTMAEGRLETTWPNTKMICTTADRAGFEALVPVARWKGFGGTDKFQRKLLRDLHLGSCHLRGHRANQRVVDVPRPDSSPHSGSKAGHHN